MNRLITGIHHVTAISGDVQQNIDFYAGILGLIPVKRTVNFENPEVYHFYFGDSTGTPGTIFTTFPYGNSFPNGRHGKGKISTTAFSVPLAGIDYWMMRLDHFEVAYKHPQERFGGEEVVIYLEDPDGMGIELIFNENDDRKPITNGAIPEKFSIKGIHHVELWLESFERTAALLTTQLNHKLIRESSQRFRFGVENSPGKFVDLLCTPDVLKGLEGRGMVHHVAFSTPDMNTQEKLVNNLDSVGIVHTKMKDRNYFRSIYFKEPGGIIFEIATAIPGFTVDETTESLGQSLQLPSWFEDRRVDLVKLLPSFVYNPQKFVL